MLGAKEKKDGDQVILSNGVPSFSSVEVGKDITVNFTEFTISGSDAGNYELIQPVATAEIYNRDQAAQNVDYVVNSNDWLNGDFVITARDGYLLSYTDTDDGTWSRSLTETEETSDGAVTFYVRNADTGAISQAVTEKYKIDRTEPAGEITIGANSWKEFLNKITFGMLFHDTQAVRIEGEDSLSGIAKIEYTEFSSALTLEEVRKLTDWTEGNRTDRRSGALWIYDIPGRCFVIMDD